VKTKNGGRTPGLIDTRIETQSAGPPEIVAMKNKSLVDGYNKTQNKRQRYVLWRRRQREPGSAYAADDPTKVTLKD
jgi:hypothetical protein